MNKKIVLITALILGNAWQADAYSLHDYVSIGGGHSAMKHRSTIRTNNSPEVPKHNWNKHVASGSVAYGLKAGYLRAEVEGNINTSAEKRRNFYSDTGIVESTVVGKIKTSSIMFNSYLELPVDFPVRPYIGAGLGGAHIKAQFKSRSAAGADKTKVSDNSFAWQAGAGIAWEITPEWAIDIGWRYMDFGSVVKKTAIPLGGGLFDASKLRVTGKSYNTYLKLRYTF